MRAWFCPFADDLQEGVRYNEWRTAADAQTHHVQNYRPYVADPLRLDGRTVGRVWLRRSPDEHDLVTATLSYARWPFSATVQSRRVAGLTAGCEFLLSRSPTDFRPSAGCART